MGELSRGGLCIQARLLFAIAALSFSGCSIADLYSGRATVYNAESEQAHDQGVLLNIVRAALRRPRQYTVVQQITGTAQASGGLNFTIPFGPQVGSTPNTALLSGNAQGGPTFQVATLETNEFFQGLMQPIPAQLIDLYFHGEFPRDVLLNLFIEKIVMRRTGPGCAFRNHEPRCEITFQNYPGADVQLELFQALAGYLIDLGLSTEPIAAAPKSGSTGGDKDKGGTCAAAPCLDYAFCFTPRMHRAAYLVPSDLVCGTPDSARRVALSRLGGVSHVGGVIISEELGSLWAAIVAHHAYHPSATAFRGIDRFSGQRVAFTIYTRSTETAVYYVGQVVRRQLYPDLDVPRHVQIKIGPPFNPFPLVPCSLAPHPPWGWSCADMFVVDVNHSLGANPTFSVNYEGVQYSIPADPGVGSSYSSRAGASYTVLSVLRQLLILNTKPSSLPSTAVLAIRSP
jgi:hypothetical protein